MLVPNSKSMDNLLKLSGTRAMVKLEHFLWEPVKPRFLDNLTPSARPGSIGAHSPSFERG